MKFSGGSETRKGSAVCLPGDRIAVAESVGIKVLPEERAFPLIIHQKISRVMAEEIFSIKNDSVLNAVECHTTLKANPSKLDLVLFVADKIEREQMGIPPYIDHQHIYDFIIEEF